MQGARQGREGTGRQAGRQTCRQGGGRRVRQAGGQGGGGGEGGTGRRADSEGPSLMSSYLHEDGQYGEALPRAGRLLVVMKGLRIPVDQLDLKTQCPF